MRNRIVTTTIKLTVLAATVAIAFAVGAGIIPVNFNITPSNEAQAAPLNVGLTPTVEVRLVETHTVEYVEATVIETEYVDVVRNVKTDLRNFNDLDELEGWINGDIVSTIARFVQQDTVIDCDDYAFEMQQDALNDGYILSFEIINIAEYNELFATPLPETGVLHAINLAIIGNSVFYIEPQTGEIVHAAYLD